MVHYVYNQNTWQTYSRSGLVLITLMLFLSVNLLYLILLLSNLDPNWSLSYALQWCVGERLGLTREKCNDDVWSVQIRPGSQPPPTASRR